MYFCYLVIFSPWKRAWPLFEQTCISFTKGCFVPSFVENGPVVLEKKMWKVYDNNNNNADGQIVIRKAHFQEPSAQVSWKNVSTNKKPIKRNRSYFVKYGGIKTVNCNELVTTLSKSFYINDFWQNPLMYMCYPDNAM